MIYYLDFYLFSVWLRHSNFHWFGDCYARNDGEKLCGEYFDRSSDLTSFVYILADAFSLRQFTSKVTFKASKNQCIFTSRKSVNLSDFTKRKKSTVLKGKKQFKIPLIFRSSLNDLA